MRTNWKQLGLLAVAICLFGCFVAANKARVNEEPVEIVGEECTIMLSPPGEPGIVGTVLSMTSDFIELKGKAPKNSKEATYYVLPVRSIVQIKFMHASETRE